MASCAVINIIVIFISIYYIYYFYHFSHLVIIFLHNFEGRAILHNMYI